MLSSAVRSILIPHGTFTMNETAKVLEEALMRQGREKKVVVLVGSLIPLCEPSSDAVENLAVAVQCLKSDQVLLPIFILLRRIK